MSFGLLSRALSTYSSQARGACCLLHMLISRFNNGFAGVGVCNNSLGFADPHAEVVDPHVEKFSLLLTSW